MKIYWDSYGILRGPSGIYVHARKLEEALSKNGIKVSILGPVAGQGSFFQPLLESKLVAPDLCFREFLRQHEGGRAVYHGLSNFNLPVAGQLVRRFGRRRDVKFVLTVHDLIPLLAPPGGVSSSLRLQSAILLPRAIKAADAVVAVSEWTARTIVDRYPWAEGRITVIPNGFPPVREDQRRGRRPGEPVRVLTVGRSENYKRHDLFFAVLEEARGALRGTLVTPGLPGGLVARAEELAARGALEVVVSPSAHELDEVYRRHDVYVQTSLFEGFCLPAAEAQASGIPVVFTSGSGIDEVVCPVSGRPVPASAPAAEWVSAILEVDFALSGKPAALAAWVGSRPTWNDSAIALKTLYNSL